MDYSILSKSVLFAGLSASEIRSALESVPHRIECYDKDEIIFHLLEDADRLGVILAGHIEAQKPFPNGSQVNVVMKGPGEITGPAAVFSSSHVYPCNVAAITPATLLVFTKESILILMQKDVRILNNFMTEIASATFLLQQRLELFSYSGISQKAAFYLLMQKRKTGTDRVSIPESMTNWAMLMNVSRTSLHRELKKLESQKIISCQTHFIDVLDEERLQDQLS